MKKLIAVAFIGLAVAFSAGCDESNSEPTNNDEYVPSVPLVVSPGVIIFI